MKLSFSRFLLAVSLLPVLCFSQAPEIHSLVADVRGIHTFDCLIHPGLPTFSFSLVGNSGNYITEIRISKKDSNVVQQVLDVELDEPPRRGSDYFQFEDLNFDGYQDLKLLTWWGSGGEGFLVWLFDPRKGQFIPNDRLSSLPNLWANGKDSTIQSYYRAGSVSKGAEVYRYEADSLILIWSESTNWIEKDQHFLKVIRIRQNGVMIDTLRQVVTEEDQ